MILFLIVIGWGTSRTSINVNARLFSLHVTLHDFFEGYVYNAWFTTSFSLLMTLIFSHHIIQMCVLFYF